MNAAPRRRASTRPLIWYIVSVRVDVSVAIIAASGYCATCGQLLGGAVACGRAVGLAMMDGDTVVICLVQEAPPAVLSV